MVEFGDHYLGLCTDGVGTKLLIAEAMQKFDTVGIDCMAMNVNDMICAGAEPLAFVDYLALAGATSPRVMEELGKGLNEGARLSNITIVGGESAVLPEMVKHNDLAGTAMGVVHRDSVVDGKNIKAGNVLIGLLSSGPHSNGYTLIRKVVDNSGFPLDHPFGNTTLGLALLEPTRIYVRPIMALLEELGKEVKGLANITGGGWTNLSRLNRKVTFNITDPLPIPPIFNWLQEQGGIAPKELYTTFNMGLGFAVVTSAKSADRAVELLTEQGESAQILGKLTERGKGPSVIHKPLGLHWY